MKKPATKRRRRPQIGSKVLTWFSDEPDGKSTVLAVRPYTGQFTKIFRYIVTLSAPRTRAGKIDMAV